MANKDAAFGGRPIRHLTGGTIRSNEYKMVYEYGANVFTGDFVFSQGIGRTDLFSGSYEEMKESINNVFLTFDKGLEVFPGHGDSDTVSNILNYNDYLKEFIDD